MIGNAPRTIRCPLLIGRDDLLELADRRLEDVIAGRGQFLLIAGEAGIGKTRLLAAMWQKAEARGLAIVVGSVAPQDQDVPAACILDLARSMTRMTRFAEVGKALLRIGDATLGAEHVRRRRLVMDAVDLIVGAIRVPTMLSFEDLQWADDLSLEIIGELARQTRDRPVLVTGDYRIEDVPPGTSLRDWRGRLVTQRIAEEIRLKPLSKADAALVTTLILDTGLPAPREVAAAVYERTDGIPLHIEELLGALTNEARADGTAILQAMVPETIDDAVVARIAHRSPQAQAVARAGAVIGRCFDPDVLAGIMDVPPETLDAPLRELVDHLVLTPPMLGNGYYDFRHQLLRDALYRTIPASDRRRFHARAGEFGARLDGSSEIHASVHYERAGLRPQAFEAARTGAQEAARLSAHREAFELYRRAVANAPDDLDGEQRGRLLEGYSDEAAAIEENAIAEQAGRAARVAYLAAGKPVRAAVAMMGVLGIIRREAGPLAERTRLATELRIELEVLPPSDERDSALRWLADDWAWIEIDMMALDAAGPTIETVRSAAIAQGDDAGRIQADTMIAMLAVLEGRVDDGLDALSVAAHEARTAGFEEVGVTAFRNAALLAGRVMAYGRAEGFLDEGMRYADDIQQSHCLHVMGATTGLVQWARGDWDDATATARQVIADHSSRKSIMMARWPLGYVAMGRGELDTAETQLAAASEIAEENGSIESILPPLWGLAECALQAGDLDLAMERCRSALDQAIAVGERALLIPFVVTGVRAALVAGRPEEAEVWLASCTEHLAGPTVPAATVALDHGRGLVAMAAGSTGIARVALEAAVAGWDARGRIWEATWARLDLATCLARINRFADAVALATDARAVASRLDSHPLAHRADAILRTARGHVPTDEPWRPLTAREFSVARLISDGLTNGEIATALGIAPRTASSHVEHILAKLGVSRRAEIAAWASRVQPTVPTR